MDMDLTSFDPNDGESLERARQVFNSEMVEDQLNKVLLICYLSLPNEEKNIRGVDREFRRVVERVLAELKDKGIPFITDA